MAGASVNPVAVMPAIHLGQERRRYVSPEHHRNIRQPSRILLITVEQFAYTANSGGGFVV